MIRHLWGSLIVVRQYDVTITFSSKFLVGAFCLVAGLLIGLACNWR